jgi:hypothetical protein
LFAKRNPNGQYSIEEINGPIAWADTALVANRCYVASPFANEDALYFGGFDPNSNVSTNMAWVYKKDFQANSVIDLNNHENNLNIYPNPAKNQVFLENINLENREFSIINLLGEQIKYGKLNGQNQTIDISNLPPNVYIIKVGNQAAKFIKAD